MKTTRFLTNISIMFVIFAMLSFQVASPTKAETNTIPIGPWIFDENAFADEATDVSSGQTGFRAGGDGLTLACDNDPTTEACLDEALTGFSPETFLENIGNYTEDNHSNRFQLDFTDIKAENNIGPDIVFFDCHFGNNSYEFAVRPEGEIFTDFMTYDASVFQSTDLSCDAPFDNWGVAIDLSDFGISSGVIVDALQFRSLPGPNGYPEGDPTMAGVLYSLPMAIFLPAVFR